MIRKFTFLFACMLTAGVAHSQIGLEGIVVEKYYVSDEADSLNADENFAIYPLHIGSVTYRVYADLLPGYKVIQMFGSAAHPLDINTTTSFYNDPNYGFSVYQGTSVTNTKKNTTLIDSYLTVGGVASGLMGVLKSEDTDGNIGNLQGILANDDETIGLPITGATGADGLMPGSPTVPNILGLTTELDVFDQTAGGTFTTSGGTIAALGGVEGVTASNHVLLGQFTTDGIFSFNLNIQIATPIEGESQIFVPESAGEGEFVDTTLSYTSPPPPSGINISEISHNANAGFVLYPNPCENSIVVKRTSGNADKATVQILDVTGRLMHSSFVNGNLQQINTTDLPSGIYTMRLESNGKAEAVKFVKQ